MKFCEVKRRYGRRCDFDAVGMRQDSSYCCMDVVKKPRSPKIPKLEDTEDSMISNLQACDKMLVIVVWMFQRNQEAQKCLS